MPESPQPANAVGEARRYWRTVVLFTIALLAIWALAGPIASILLVEQLNTITLGGFPLGFWMSQQGSILVFVGLIFVYALVMNRLDRKHRERLK